MNGYEMIWENKALYFDTLDEIKKFVKNGTQYIKSVDIRVEGVFELNKIDFDLNQ